MFLVCFALLSCGTSGSQPSVLEPPVQPPLGATDSVKIVVDNTLPDQRIDGFGGTLRSLVFPDGDHLGTFRAGALATAFDSVGISRGLIGIGVVETRAAGNDLGTQRQNDNADPMVLELTGFNFADFNVLNSTVLAPARAYGFTSSEFGPLLDYRYQLDWLRAIRGHDYQRYLDEAAENVLAVVQHWRTVNGQAPKLVHLFNEPTSGNKEIFSGATQEVVDLVARIGTRLRSAGITETRFIVPNEESMARSLEVASAILADPVAGAFVGVIGFHQYPEGSVSASPRRMLSTSGAGNPDPTTRNELAQLRALGARYGVPLWMTEVSEGPYNADYAFGAIEHVLARAVHIHDVLVYGGASAFFGMNTLWDAVTHEQHFAGRSVPFLKDEMAIVLVDQPQNRIRISGVGYAIGHFARWMDSTAIRVESTSENSRVIVTAFRDPDKSRMVVVVVNTNDQPQRVSIALLGAAASGPVVGETTFGTVRWQKFQQPVRNDGTVSYTVAASSVTTLAIPIR